MPKIIFKISKKYDIETISRFISPKKGDWDWRNHLFYYHSNLRDKLNNIRNIETRKKIVKNYVNEFYAKNTNLNDLVKTRIKFQEAWEYLDKQYTKLLKKILTLNDISKESITCFISICPICPRNIKKRNFSVFYKQNLFDARLTIAHELLHFYYFDKWKIVFPKSKEEEFEGPHIVWHLSEILAPILLNTKEIQKILGKRARWYKEYERLKVNNGKLTKYFERLYKRFDFNNKTFADFLKEAYSEIKKFKKEVMGA